MTLQARRRDSSSPATTKARCASSPSCSRRSASTCVSAGKPRPARARGDRRRPSPRMPRSRRLRRRRPPGCSALADDSGLEVAALGGAPGIHSARWGGPDKDFGLAMERVHRELEASGARDRRANFICALALAAPDGGAEVFEGKVFGTLIWPPRGTRGFGYDPIFVPDGYSETFGEMEPELKDRHLAPHPRLRETDAGRPMTMRLSLRGLCALAVLPRQMPLLRLQLPCPAWRHRRGAASSPPICAELEHFASLAPGRIVSSIFFGGGTPSLMAPETVGAILDAHRRALAVSRPTPRSRSKPIRPASRPESFAGYRAAGVNRLSLGVQALDDASLKALGRQHTAKKRLPRSRSPSAISSACPST